MNSCKRRRAAIGRWFTALLSCALLPACGGGSGSGTIATTVSSSNPSNSSVDVPTSTKDRNNVVTGTFVTATFSEAMDPTTLTSSPAGTLLTFTFRETAGANVPGTVAMNTANTTATFTPSAAALAANTTYTATVTTAAKDSGGTALANDVSWSFTTRATTFTGQSPVDLGLAGTYAVFANTGIDNATVPAAITADMGVGPGVTSTAITGFSLDLPAGSAFSTSTQVTGKVYAFDYAAPTPTSVTTASNNMGAAYTDAAGRTLPDFLDVGGGNLGGLTLTPGLHRWASNVTLPFGTNVTLSGGADDIWILQITGTLVTGASTNVFLSGGAQAKNVFWQIAGTTMTLGANAHFEGIVLAQNAINFGNQATANSRLLAQTAVNLNQNAVTQPAQ